MTVDEFAVNSPARAKSAFIEALNSFGDNAFENKGKITDDMITALKNIDHLDFQYKFAEVLDKKWESLKKAKSGYGGLKSKADKYKKPASNNVSGNN